MLARPPLPVRSANPFIKDHLSAPHLPPVKYQILNCQGKDILVGRLKIETPTVRLPFFQSSLMISADNFGSFLQDSGHAFILRRFDTGAVSLTTMYRAAFPSATDHEEKLEIAWVKDTYDLGGNNGSTKDAHITRLAGTWVSPDTALELGKAYALGTLIDAVVEAKPDPEGNYRRSGKAAAAASAANVATAVGVPVPAAANAGNAGNAAVVHVRSPSKPVSAVKSLPTPSPTAAVNPPAKRRKESSPAPVSRGSSKPPSRASPSAAPPPRRSARTKSPAPRSSSVAPLTSVVTQRTPKATRSITKKETVTATSLTPGGSELTVVDEENLVIEEHVAGAELREQDIREQQKMIADLKRDAAAKLEREERESMGSSRMDVGEDKREKQKKKREREEEEEPLRFEFREPEREERAIATNRRVGRFHLEPRAKSFAWGLAAFAIGMGAV
ncbi:hypothetical protein B0H34DRAFT_785148 [Crassisporium funariophilum]|nr:hypothetical protein B0H34DRAFT_785148 [Crassisporium funariophilum]